MAGRIVERTLVEGEAVQGETAAHVLEEDDTDAVVRIVAAGGVACTVPPDADVDFPTGSEVDVIQGGAGAVTITAGAGVTLQASGGLVATAAQHARVKLQKIADNTWNVSGDRA